MGKIDKKEVVKLAKEGLTLSEIASKIGCSKGRVSQILKEMGVLTKKSPLKNYRLIQERQAEIWLKNIKKEYLKKLQIDDSENCNDLADYISQKYDGDASYYRALIKKLKV